MTLRTLFSFQQAQYIQVFPLKSAPFCMLFAGLGSINKPATSLLLSDSRSVLTTQSSPPSFLYLKLSGRSDRNSLFSSVLSGYNGSLGTRFSRGTTQLMSWPDKYWYSCALQSLVISRLLSLISTSLFSEWRRTVSSRFFDTQFPSVSTEELVLAVCCLVFAPTHTACC